jgi:hypothetical protein
MRTTTKIGLLAVSVLALAACHPKDIKHSDFAKVDISTHSDSSDSDEDKGPALKTVATLDCPDHEGALTRTAQSPDGKSCDYQGPGDETVNLSLVALDGKTPIEAVSAVKAELKGLVNVQAANSPISVDASKDDGGDHAKVDMPFLHVDAHGKKANVNIMGFNIDADDDKGTATVKGDLPGIHNAVVHAGPGGAEILAEDVGKTNASLVYILAGDKAGPQGYHAVGYVAKGPAAGPLVMAKFRAKQGHHGSEDEHGDLGRLIDRNVKN